jgi:hypothetical protein
LRDNAVEGEKPVDKFFDKLTTALDPNGSLSAENYKKLTQTGSYVDNLRKSPNSELRDLGRQIDGSINDDLATSAGPQARDILNDTDRKYALWNNANEARDDVTGQVNPAAFSREAWKKNSRYFKSQQNLNNPSDSYNLANIAEQLKLNPSSGTAENLLLSHLPSALGIGGGGGLLFGEPHLATGALGSLALGKAAGSALSSDWYRNYLINQAKTLNHPSSLLGLAAPTGYSVNK